MTEPTTTYTWRIEQLDAAPTEGDLISVVRTIHWRLLGTDGINTMDLYGDAPLAGADPDDFTNYEDLTEATVVDWLEAAIDDQAGDGGPTVQQLRANLAGMLAAQRTPDVTPLPVPWSS
jgi:hypothetical protein